MYAVRTGTKRNLAGIRAKGWGLLISAQGVLRDEGFTELGLDNGAWTTRNKEPFDAVKFRRALKLFGKRVRFVVVPDIVFGGKASLEFSLSWLSEVQGETERVLIPVQDDMEPADIEGLLGSKVGVFIGGGDDFKERSAGMWCALARSRGAWCHMGRVNAMRRIHIAMAAGCNSIDGSGASRFFKHQSRVHRAVSQTSLLVEPTE